MDYRHNIGIICRRAARPTLILRKLQMVYAWQRRMMLFFCKLIYLIIILSRMRDSLWSLTWYTELISWYNYS